MPANITDNCYFLNNYRDENIDENEALDIHIQAAIKELGIVSSNM